MRCLLLALMMTFAAQSKAAEVLRATDEELKTARFLYSESIVEVIKKQWLLEKSREKYQEGRDFLLMSVTVDETGKVQDTRIIESEGNVARLEQITKLAIKNAPLKPMPPMLGMDLKEKKLGMPSVLIRVPFIGMREKNEPKEALTFKSWYTKEVTKQVEAKWHLLRTLRKDEITFGSLNLYFLVSADGKIPTIKIVEDKVSNKVLNEITIEAIKSVKPPAMPPELIEELKSEGLLHLKIEYNVLIY